MGAINYISFGTLIKLIECFAAKKLNEFMNGKNYKKPITAFDPTKVYLKSIQMLRNKISHHSNILGKKSPFHIRGHSYSIYFIGYYGISAWVSFLLNEPDISNRLKNEIDMAIKKINNLYETQFTFSIFMCKTTK